MKKRWEFKEWVRRHWLVNVWWNAICFSIIGCALVVLAVMIHSEARAKERFARSEAAFYEANPHLIATQAVTTPSCNYQAFVSLVEQE